jgi:FXSXX-COOH protein
MRGPQRKRSSLPSHPVPLDNPPGQAIVLRKASSGGRMSAGDAAGDEAGALPPDDEGAQSDLPDLSAVSLADLRLIDGSPIARSVARLIEESIDPGEATAGFNSAV